MEDRRKKFLETLDETGLADNYPKDVDEETLARAKELEDYLYGQVRAYEETEGNLWALLERDYELLEELADEAALLRIAELTEDTYEPDYDLLETAYLNVIDKLFQLSKTYHPLSEMGKDRLLGALTITEEFEEKYRPLLTQVTAENIGKFASYLTEREYDDVRCGRKNAIGALRHEDGHTYAAGIIVYHFETGMITEEPILRVDYIYVGRDFRQKGVGNHLIGRLMCFAAEYLRCPVTVAYAPPASPDEGQQQVMDALTNCLDSWGFDFTMNFGKGFCIKLADIKGNSELDRTVSGVTPLRELGEAGERMVTRFLTALNEDEAEAYPYEYYDKDISCAVVENGRISALLLIHAYKSGNYRLIFSGSLKNTDPAEQGILYSYAYRAYIKKGAVGGTLSGEFASEEGRELLTTLVPTAKMLFTYEGMLMKPVLSDDMSTELWMELMKELDKPPIFSEPQPDALFEEKTAAEIREVLEKIAAEA